jgi:hypothetical protein
MDERTKERDMGRRVWIGVAAGLLAGLLVLGVGVAAFGSVRESEPITRTVTDTDGEVVRVVEVDGWRGHRGPGVGVVLIPLVGLGLLALAFGAGRRSGWAHGGPGWGGYGYGYGAPGRGPWGPGCGPGDQPWGQEPPTAPGSGETAPPTGAASTSPTVTASEPDPAGPPAAPGDEPASG